MMEALLFAVDITAPKKPSSPESDVVMRRRRQAAQSVPRDTVGHLRPTIPPVSSLPSSGHRRHLHFHSIRQRLQERLHDKDSRASSHLSVNHVSEPKDLLRKIKKKTKNAFHLSRNQETIACLSCYDEHARRELIRLSCQHSYCKQCFHQLVLNALQSEQDWPPKCCSGPIDHNTSLKNIPRALTTVYKQKLHEYSVPMNERYYCPTPDCGLFVPADKANTPYRRARCKNKHVTCMDCLKPAHTDAAECPRNRDMELVTRMAQRQGWRRCTRCLTMIEHRTACRHMQCRCGAEFCFVCGRKWWTCGCTERQLKEMKQRVALDAERRRAEELRARAEELRARARLQWGWLDGGDQLGDSRARRRWFVTEHGVCIPGSYHPLP